ncbi:hypothetical protein GCM10028815_30060 [Mariniluteicoccus flavus]
MPVRVAARVASRRPVSLRVASMKPCESDARSALVTSGGTSGWELTEAVCLRGAAYAARSAIRDRWTFIK